jgi:hypothetical protein
VSDLSGKQADEDAFARLIVPDDEQYVSVELIQPGGRSGRRAIIALERFNKLASSGDMNTVLMNAVVETHQRRGGQVVPVRGRSRKDRVDYATIEHAGRPHRGRITDAEKELVRNNLDRINTPSSLRRSAGN